VLLLGRTLARSAPRGSPGFAVGSPGHDPALLHVSVMQLGEGHHRHNSLYQ